MTNKKLTIGILANVDAGKTTLSEALLYLTGEIKKPGRVDRGDSFLDDDVIERNRGITIFSRQAYFTVKSEDKSFDDTEVTLIDTPGHVDFSAETERALSVLDYALLVVSGSEGVQAHTRTLYRLLKERGIPVFIFVNKMDIAVRQKEAIIEELRLELGADAVDFSGASQRSDEFIDEVTLFSSEIAEAVLSGGFDEPAQISDEMLARAASAGGIVPCVFGSALKLEGIEGLLELMARYTAAPEYGEEFGAKIYKTAEADDGERLCFIKITGGELRVRDRVLQRSAAGGEGKEAKINQIRLYSGSRCTQVECAAAGTVCAVTGLSRALPGDSLGAEEPLSGMELKPFMVHSVIVPEGKDRYEVMDDLKKLTEEDPALSASWSADRAGIELRLMGRVQLEVLQAVVKERFGYEIGFGSGNVLYLETINGRYEGVGHFEPLRHYAEVHLVVEPGERGSGIVLASDVSEDELSLNWQRLILTHLEEKEHKGVLTGSPLTDVKIRLAAGRAHEKHTTGGDFREATYRAVRNALMQAREDGNAVLLEPWCRYELELPAQSLGRAMTDIKQMGGSQDELSQPGDTAVIKGRVPAAGIAGYQLTLAGYTSGEGRLSTSADGYDICADAAAVTEEKAYDPERDVENSADSVFVNHDGSDIVRWCDVPAHMHIGSVLKERGGASGQTDAPAGKAVYRKSGEGAPSDVREEAKRRMAAEKELRQIFERTYGAEKKTRRIERQETDYGAPQLSEEEAARNAERSAEIRAKHERRTLQAGEKPVMILVDGYNLIFADPYLKDLAGRDTGSARDQLIEKLCNYAGYTGCELVLIFDAYRVKGGAGCEEQINGIRVVYTAADEPADIRMGMMTEQIRDRQIYVVSSDMLVQQDAWGHGALRISSHEFTKLLERTAQEIRDRLAEKRFI